MDTVTEFRLLGPLLVRRGGVTVPVTPGKQRAVLAALLLSANRVVSFDELTEALWGPAPPPSARVAVQNHVMRLRKALGGATRIRTHPHGYEILVDGSDLDVSGFEAHLAAARAAAKGGLWDVAAGQARAGLALWRGEPLAGVESELLATRDIPRLAELRLQALEVRLDADLRLGRHAEVITELHGLAAAHPLRERVHSLLLLALYRDGRQAEALAAYVRCREIVVDELGSEPGAGLRQLQRQILNGDPALDPPAQAPGTADYPVPPVPRELPTAVSGFTGRAAELAALTRTLNQASQGSPGTVVISAIGGTAGVGKTALALRWAHQVAARFPDGQLYVNLRGFDPSDVPMPTADALRGFLDALGVPPDRIPAQPDAWAGLYRRLLADRRMLIVLDNARDEQQVRPLLPASPASLVVVSSRTQLGGLAAADGARLLTLDVLSQEEAVQMLTARIGAGRAAAEPAAAAEIASLCGRLPLALAVAAARAEARPDFPLAAVAAELRDRAGRLEALDAGDPGSSVPTVFSWSTRQLSAAAARMFRLLGLHPGPDIIPAAAASLAAADDTEARRLLSELARAHLIAEHLPGRYVFHDLLRAYAAEQARHTDSDTDRREAAGRVLDYYLHTAARAALLLDPAREPVALAPPRPGTVAGQPADHRQALAWFEAEHQVLLTAVTLAAGSGFDSHAWQLPWAMTPFLQNRGHWLEWAATQRTALAAATRLGDAAAQALSGRLLANAYSKLGDHDQAHRHYASSLTLYQKLGSRLGEGKIHQHLSVLAEAQGRYADALGHAQQALRLYQAVGDKANAATMVNDIGWYHGLLGDYRQARAFCRQALTLCAEADHRWLEGCIWDSLGYAEHHAGSLADAAACYQRALSIAREAGARFNEAGTLTRLGDTRHAAGEAAEARQAWHQALTILDDLQHPDADQVRVKLASTTGDAASNPSG
jgi:DNA-binding SARP family transcriptional activator